jgi:hypothetical protein
VATAIMNSFGRTALTVAVAAGLFGYIYFVESRKDPKTEAPGGASGKREKVFTGFDKLKVTSITLSKRDGGVIEAEKNGDRWALVSPRDTAADSPSIASMLDALERLETEDIVTEAAPDLAPFGLSPPKIAVSVVAEGAGKPFELEIGDSVPAGSGLFARVPGKPRLFTVSSLVENTFDKTAFDLRDRSLIHAKKDDVRWFELSKKGRTVFRLARDEAGGEWEVQTPLTTRAAKWTVEGFLGLIENIRMDSIPTEQATPQDLSKYGLGKAARRLTLGLDESKSVTLEIGKKTEDGKYFARDGASSLVAIIDAGVADDLEKGLKNLRAARLLEVAAYEVTGFDVASQGVTRTFTKSTSKGKDGMDEISWKSAAPTKDLTQDKASDAFFSVGALDAAEFIDAPRLLAAYGLDLPAVRVTLRFDGDKKEDWFEVAVRGEEAFGRRRGDSAVLKLDKTKTEALIKTFTDLGS